LDEAVQQASEAVRAAPKGRLAAFALLAASYRRAVALLLRGEPPAAARAALSVTLDAAAAYNLTDQPLACALLRHERLRVLLINATVADPWSMVNRHAECVWGAVEGRACRRHAPALPPLTSHSPAALAGRWRTTFATWWRCRACGTAAGRTWSR
jgi:hypothetical protein